MASPEDFENFVQAMLRYPPAFGEPKHPQYEELLARAVLALILERRGW